MVNAILILTPRKITTKFVDPGTGIVRFAIYIATKAGILRDGFFPFCLYGELEAPFNCYLETWPQSRVLWRDVYIRNTGIELQK